VGSGLFGGFPVRSGGDGAAAAAEVIDVKNDQPEADQEVQVVYAEEPTAEQKARAARFLLPESFYLYENKASGCPGCVGCEREDVLNEATGEGNDESPPEVDQIIIAGSPFDGTQTGVTVGHAGLAPTCSGVQLSERAHSTTGEFAEPEEAPPCDLLATPADLIIQKRASLIVRGSSSQPSFATLGTVEIFADSDYPVYWVAFMDREGLVVIRHMIMKSASVVKTQDSHYAVEWEISTAWEAGHARNSVTGDVMRIRLVFASAADQDEFCLSFGQGVSIAAYNNIDVLTNEGDAAHLNVVD
jgi:hypothetical protein